MYLNSDCISGQACRWERRSSPQPHRRRHGAPFVAQDLVRSDRLTMRNLFFLSRLVSNGWANCCHIRWNGNSPRPRNFSHAVLQVGGIVTRSQYARVRCRTRILSSGTGVSSSENVHPCGWGYRLALRSLSPCPPIVVPCGCGRGRRVVASVLGWALLRG